MLTNVQILKRNKHFEQFLIQIYIVLNQLFLYYCSNPLYNTRNVSYGINMTYRVEISTQK